MNQDPIDSSGTIHLIHGWGMHNAMWGPLPRYLSEAGYRCIPHELPGHGHTPKVPGLCLDTLTSYIAEQIDTPGLVLGWSLGGLVAMQLAIVHPERLTGLILTGVNPCFITRPDWPNGMDHHVFDQFRRATEHSVRDAMNTFVGLMDQTLPARKGNLRDLRHLYDSEPPADTGTLQSGLTILENSDLRAASNSIRHRTLVIHGKNDQLVPFQAARILADTLSDARLNGISRAGHMPFLAHPVAFVSAVKGTFDA